MPRLIKDISISKHKIVVTPSAEIESWFSEPLFISSDSVDFSDTPVSIAAMPFLLNAAPIAWRLGDWQEPLLSKSLQDSLETARINMQSLWPQYDWNGKVSGSAPDLPKAVEGKALLFSGGLDSTFSAMQLLGDKPALITIHGGRDLQLADDGAWRSVELATSKFSAQHELESVQIRSNFTSALSPEIDNLCQGLPASWWASVQHGMGLVGVAAPVLHAMNKAELVISATHSTGHQSGWGSHPLLEGVLSWDSGSVNHFGYDHNRTQKIKALHDLAQNLSVPVPELIVCTRRNRSGNCLSCAKCLRTLGSVLVLGLKPSIFGLGITPESGARLIAKSIPAKINFGANEKYAWGAIQQAARDELEQRPKDKFLKWLSRADFDKSPKKFSFFT